MSTCKTCRYYVPKGLVNPGLGSCRYNPPALSLFLTPQGATSVADFPPVNEELWCRCHDQKPVEPVDSGNVTVPWVTMPEPGS